VTTPPARIIALEEHMTTEAFLAATESGTTTRPSAATAKLLDVGAGRLADMDASQIDVQVLSLSSAGLDQLDRAPAAALARATNDALAAAVRAHPDRFAAFATLALQEPEDAARELDRCVNDLGFKGLVAMGTVNGLFLDDARFTPVFDAAHSLDVPIYLHPGLPPQPVLDAYYSGLPGTVGRDLAAAGWGFHAETGLHCLRLMLSGLFDRFPKLKIIIGHMGEHLPYNIARSDWTFARSARRGGTLPFKRTVLEYFREHFYLTTSGYFTVPPLLCALQVIGADRVLFSVDYPLAHNAEAKEFLDALPVGPEDLEKIAHRNAERLLKL
jgi:uncharacterized protein